MMTCAGCNLYEPDQVNPRGGLGDCPVNRANPKNIIIQHKDSPHIHRMLIYPNTTGCSEWERKPE